MHLFDPFEHFLPPSRSPTLDWLRTPTQGIDTEESLPSFEFARIIARRPPSPHFSLWLSMTAWMDSMTLDSRPLVDGHGSATTSHLCASCGNRCIPSARAGKVPGARQRHPSTQNIEDRVEYLPHLHFEGRPPDLGLWNQSLECHIEGAGCDMLYM